MSREIKFRAWDKKHRKYTKILKIYFGSGGNNLGALVEDYETNYAFELQVNQVELEQYTGLKDKDGKEIYEGDIVKGDMGIFEVKWYDLVAQFMFRPNMSMKYHPPFTSTQLEVMEVIGNIHEPPKDFRPEHLKRMGVSISKGGEE